MIAQLSYQQPRTVEIEDPEISSRGVRLLVRLEYENHPAVKGNKWWKLKENIAEISRLNKDTILTFGGAYSNHVYATAAATNTLQLKSVGVIRGEKVNNEVLDFAIAQGMVLEFVSRETYRTKTDKDFLQQLASRYNAPYILPEGGTNELAIKGCEQWGQQLNVEHAFDALVLPVGTGGTIAGLVCGLKGSKKVTGISVLKNGSFLNDTVANLIKNYSSHAYGNWNILTSYDHGGYARTTEGLSNFMTEMRRRHSLPLDHVYTGKMMFGIWNEITKGTYPRGTTILALHTGGVYSNS